LILAVALLKMGTKVALVTLREGLPDAPPNASDGMTASAHPAEAVSFEE
jgi:hypothetical protein